MVPGLIHPRSAHVRIVDNKVSILLVDSQDVVKRVTCWVKLIVEWIFRTDDQVLDISIVPMCHVCSTLNDSGMRSVDCAFLDRHASIHVDGVRPRIFECLHMA